MNNKKRLIWMALLSLPLILCVLAIISFSSYIYGFEIGWSFMTLENAIITLVISCLCFIASCAAILLIIIKMIRENKK
jgi:ABC-type methionine transport system permease subunit